jgi:hypothetical protein
MKNPNVRIAMTIAETRRIQAGRIQRESAKHRHGP